jgi:hypothetical protein
MENECMRCAHCREEVGEEYVEYKGKVYCCPTCAFEASLKLGSMCGSRSSVEAGMRFVRSQRHRAS